MKSLKCSWFTLLYALAAAGAASFKGSDHLAVHWIAIFAEGFCSGIAICMALLTIVCLVFPKLGCELHERY